MSERPKAFRFLIMRFWITFLVLAPCVLPAAAESPSPALQKAASGVTKTIVQGDDTFTLVNSTATKNVETNEFTTAGESLTNWTQLLTVQRLAVVTPASSQAFVAYFKKQAAEGGASLEVLSETKQANVFVVRFPQLDGDDEQVMICLAVSDAENPMLLNVVQYTLRPTQCPVTLAATRIKSWRDKFLIMARILGRRPS